MLTACVTGFGLGFFVAAQLGPISLLLIRTVLRGSVLAGLAIGAGAAFIDGTYALLGVAGASRFLENDALRTGMGAVGAAVLALLGLRTLWMAFRVRSGGEADIEVATPRAAFATSVAATASNPLTILSWAAIFAAASTAEVTTSTATTVALVAFIVIGSLSWFAILTLGLALTRRRFSERALMAIDVGSGLGLLIFSALLGYRTATES
jgi:threonine/homoserine/homoserine lactone efflux protein